jgi:hypothetical protein
LVRISAQEVKLSSCTFATSLLTGASHLGFSTLRRIIQASFEFDYQRSLDVFEAATASDDLLSALTELIAFFFRGLEVAAELGAGRVNVQGWGEALVNPPLRETLQRVMTHYLGALTQIVRQAQARGQLDPTVDPHAFRRVLLSLYYGLELQKALDPAVEVAAYDAAVSHGAAACSNTAVLAWHGTQTLCACRKGWTNNGDHDRSRICADGG